MCCPALRPCNPSEFGSICFDSRFVVNGMSCCTTLWCDVSWNIGLLYWYCCLLCPWCCLFVFVLFVPDADYWGSASDYDCRSQYLISNLSLDLSQHKQMTPRSDYSLVDDLVVFRSMKFIPETDVVQDECVGYRIWLIWWHENETNTADAKLILVKYITISE